MSLITSSLPPLDASLTQSQIPPAPEKDLTPEIKVEATALETLSGQKRKRSNLSTKRIQQNRAKTRSRVYGRFIKSSSGDASVETVAKPAAPIAKRIKSNPLSDPLEVPVRWPLFTEDAAVESPLLLSPTATDNPLELLENPLEKMPSASSPLLKAAGGAGALSEDLAPEVTKNEESRARSPYIEMLHRHFVEEFKEVLLSEYRITDPSHHPLAVSRIALFLVSKLESGMSEPFLKRAMKEALSEFIETKFPDEASRKAHMEEVDNFMTHVLALTFIFDDGIRIEKLLYQIIQKTFCFQFTHDKLTIQEIEEEIAECSDKLQLSVDAMLKAGANAHFLKTHIQNRFRTLSETTFGKSIAPFLCPITDAHTEILIRMAKKN